MAKRVLPTVLIVCLLGITLGVASAVAAAAVIPSNPLVEEPVECTVVPELDDRFDPIDGSYQAVVQLGVSRTLPLQLRRLTENGGSVWVESIVNEDVPFSAVSSPLTDAEDYVIRYRQDGRRIDVPCFTRETEPLAPACSVAAGRTDDNEPIWSVLVDAVRTVDYTLRIDGTEVSSNAVPFTDRAGNENVWFQVPRVATPVQTIEVAPTARRNHRGLCGKIGSDATFAGSCTVRRSPTAPGDVWIDVEAKWPLPFTVERDGVDLGAADPIRFDPARFPELQPADVWRVQAEFDPTAEWIVRHAQVGVVCSVTTDGIDQWGCVRDGDRLTWTPQDADGGEYHVRRVTEAGSRWEQVVPSTTAVIDVPSSSYVIRWRERGAVVDRYCTN